MAASIVGHGHGGIHVPTSHLSFVQLKTLYASDFRISNELPGIADWRNLQQNLASIGAVGHFFAKFRVGMQNLCPRQCVKCGMAAYFAVKGSQKPPELDTLIFSMKNQAKLAKYTESTSL